MTRLLRTPVLVACLLRIALVARGHEPDFTPEDRATIRAAMGLLQEALTSSGRLTPEAAWAVDLGEFTTHELDHLPDMAGADERLREALGHVCRTTYYRRAPVGRIKNSREVCFLLGSRRGSDWLKAFRLLRREPITADMERAVVALGRDDQPEIRLIAAKLAASLIMFGRDSKGLTGTVIACVSDPDPNVAASFSAREALDIGDKRIIDRVVASLSDHRPLDPRASPILNLRGYERVSDVLVPRLSWMIYRERRARQPVMGSARSRSRQPQYVKLASNEIRAWWKQNREEFGFETPRPQWRCVLDEVLVLDVRKPVVVRTAGGIPLKVRLRKYRESWRSSGTPVTTVEGEITAEAFAEEQHVAGIGNPRHYDGFVSRERTLWAGDGTVAGELLCRAVVLPTRRPGRVRMRLILHVGYEEKEPWRKTESDD